MTPIAILRVIGAAAALVGGYAHLALYNNEGYKDISSDIGDIGPLDVGEQFLLNAIGGLLIAVGLLASLVVRQLPAVLWKLAALGGIAWASISLVASYFAKETTRGWFGFQDRPGLEPAPEAAMSVFSEIVVLVAMVVALVLAMRRPVSGRARDVG